MSSVCWGRRMKAVDSKARWIKPGTVQALPGPQYCSAVERSGMTASSGEETKTLPYDDWLGKVLAQAMPFCSTEKDGCGRPACARADSARRASATVVC